MPEKLGIETKILIQFVNKYLCNYFTKCGIQKPCLLYLKTMTGKQFLAIIIQNRSLRSHIPAMIAYPVNIIAPTMADYAVISRVRSRQSVIEAAINLAKLKTRESQLRYCKLLFIVFYQNI